MSEYDKDWQPNLLWLVLIKGVYLAALCLALRMWPNFDEEKCSAVNARWFHPSAQVALPEGRPGLARHFSTWDAQHYLLLSESGYCEGLESCAFYPLWPLVIRWFSLLTGASHLVAGMVLANVFSLAAWTIFYQVCARRFGGSVAQWALAWLILFPGSLFYQFIYSESLFFLLVMMLWYGLERERYGWAWVAAFLLPLTRAIGAFAALPIAWFWLMRHGRGWFKQWGWLNAEQEPVRGDRAANSVVAPWQGYALLTASPLGLAFYFGLMWAWTGSPFEGIEAQKYWSAHAISNLWDVPKFVTGWFSPWNLHDFKGSTLDRCIFLILLCALPLIWRTGKDMALWSYVLGIAPAMSGTFTSYTRFACCAFPMFIALAVLSKRQQWPWLKLGLLAAFGLLHIVLLWRFVNFRWAG
jgi:hypothetical protein